MRREYGGAVPKAALSVALGGTTADLTIICDDLTGWPTGVNPFFVIANRGRPTEEKMLISTRTGNVLTVWSNGGSYGRALDNTAISMHEMGEYIEHIFTATDADEANEHVNTGTGAHGYPAIADLVTLNGIQTLTNKTMSGASSTFTDIPQSAVTDLIADLAEKAVYPTQTGHANEVLGTNGTVVSWVPRPTDGVDGADGAGIYYQPTAPVAPLDGEVWVDSDNIVATPVYLPAGGAADEVLAKVDGTDYNVDWVPQSGGGATTLPALTDVTITSVADNDVLTYDSGTSQWVNAVPAPGGGGAVGGGTDAVFYEADTNVTTSYTITAGKNAVTPGPVTIDSGATVTVPSGSAWVIV